MHSLLLVTLFVFSNSYHFVPLACSIGVATLLVLCYTSFNGITHDEYYDSRDPIFIEATHYWQYIDRVKEIHL